MIKSYLVLRRLRAVYFWLKISLCLFLSGSTKKDVSLEFIEFRTCGKEDLIFKESPFIFHFETFFFGGFKNVIGARISLYG